MNIILRSSRTSYRDPSPTPVVPNKRSEKSETVQVVVRCRPMSHKERTQGHTQIIDMWPKKGIVYITNPKRNHGCACRTFAFDSVYDWNANQDDLYNRTVQPLVYSVLDGFNGTIFAYGQTGTGKTYTMLGSRGNPKEKGIIAKCFEEIFAHISYNSKHISYLVRASYFEIYQEETRDLLSQDIRKKPLREDVVRGVYVKGLQSVVCKNIKAIEKVMRIGNMNRATAATNMNEHSSRSHAIFQITVEMRDRGAPDTVHTVRIGKLNLVDLAGSERQCKTGAVGERLKESGKINLSLSALGNVISALVDGKSSHIPYRDSKLTQLLQDSLGGSSKSIMIANIGPASYNYDESLMTLRYASRAKHIRNHPTRNHDGNRPDFSRYNAGMRALKRLIIDEPVDTSSSNASRGMTSENTSSSSEQITDGNSTPSSSEPPTGRVQRVESEPAAKVVFNKHPKDAVKCIFRNKSRVDDIRRRRTHRKVVWRLRGKYHQETTIKLVKWLQEQMAQSVENEREAGEGSSNPSLAVTPCSAEFREGSYKRQLLEGSAGQKGDSQRSVQASTRNTSAKVSEGRPTEETQQSSFTEIELGTQKLIDELSYFVKRKTMLLSIAQLSEENRRRRKQVRALQQLAEEMRNMRERTQNQQHQETQVILAEKRRLLRELALRSAVVRSYFTEMDHRRIKSCCCYDDQKDKWFLQPLPVKCASKTSAGAGGDADSAFCSHASSQNALATTVR